MSNRSSGFAPNGYPTTSATGRVLERAELYGYTPGHDEPDSRPVADDDALDGLVDTMYAAVGTAFADTSLEGDVDALLYSLTYAFHHQVERSQRILDANEDRIREARDEDDGSEVTSSKLERLVDKGRLLEEKRDAFEHLRDAAKTAYSEQTGKVWTQRSGSVVNHRKMTAASIESRDYLSAKRYKETNVLVPPGPKVAVAGGLDYNDHTRIFAVLDKVHAQHPTMVLVHGGADRGTDNIAARWAQNHNVPCIAIKPDWNRYQKAAPFKRNDQMLDLSPIGVVLFPGNGITENLADKAKKLGIPLTRGGAAKQGA